MTTDHTIERRLRDTFAAVAASTEAEDRWTEVVAGNPSVQYLEPLVAPGTPGHRMRRPIVVAATAFAVVLVTVGSIALASALLVGTGRDVPPLSPDAQDAADRFPVPRYAPAGVEDVWAQMPFGSDTPVTVAAVVGSRRSDGVDGVEQITYVMVRSATSSIDDRTVVDTVRSGDRNIFVLSEGATGGSISLTWTEGGLQATVYAADGDRDRALAVIEGTTLSGDDPAAPGTVVIDPPPGLQVIAAPTVLSQGPSPMVTMQWNDWPTDGTPLPTAAPPGGAGADIPPEDITVLDVDIQVLGDSPEHLLGFYSAAESFELRGRPAYLTSSPCCAVLWEETPGTTVMVSGRPPFPVGELISIAEDLELTDEESWRDLFDVDPSPDVPSTTSGPNSTHGPGS